MRCGRRNIVSPDRKAKTLATELKARGWSDANLRTPNR